MNERVMKVLVDRSIRTRGEAVKIQELIDLLSRKCEEHGIGDFDAVWMDLDTQEIEEIETIEINPRNETVLFR